MVYVLGLMPRTVHLGFTKCIAHKKNDNYYYVYSPGRGGKGSERQCRARQDSVDPGWVGHSKIGRVRREWTGLCKAGYGRSVTDRAGQGPAPGRLDQGSASQDRVEPGRVEKYRTGPEGATKGRSEPDRAGQALAPGMITRTGQGQEVQC